MKWKNVAFDGLSVCFWWFFDETGWYYVMLVTADLDNEIAMKTGENIWKEMPFQLCLSPAVISYLFLQNAKLLEGCVCVCVCK